MSKKLAYIFFGLFILHRLLLWWQPLGPILKDMTFSRQVLDRNGELLRLTTAKDQTYRIYQELNEISPYAREATLLYEDRYFFWHLGINPYSLVRAMWTTYVKKQRVIGASTITMQLARYLFKVESRSVGGKILQIFRALQLEFLYSKGEILQAYFNVVPYGFNIEGIGAASLIYFKKPSRELTQKDAMTLVVIPQSPFERTRGIRRTHLAPKSLQQARLRLFEYWKGVYPQSIDLSQNMKLPIKMRPPHDLPFLAPHFTTERLLDTDSMSITSTLDREVQTVLENLASRYVEKNKKNGINNTAIAVIDTQNMEMLGYLGSVDFFDESIQGQVDGVQARRSPGSALKPFVYGLALEQGLIHPKTMLKDAPTPFGTYTPDNFDRAYAGPLSATDALIHSRNIPAIELSQNLRNPSLYDFLKSADIPLNDDPKFYGLSIVLGTAEVTMQELLQLYAMLNNGGVYRPIKKRLSNFVPEYMQSKMTSSEQKKLLSSEASFLLLDMLKENPKSVDDAAEKWTLQNSAVAWKTGTSVGFRDAWSVGIFGHYALAVWVGNFDGKGNPVFVGRQAAGKLFFQLIEALQKVKGWQAPEFLPTADLEISQVEVCALSGGLPQPHCPHRQQTWFIPGKSPIQKCEIHRMVDVDIQTGLLACAEFNGETRLEAFEFWPSDMLKLFKQAGLARKLPPLHHPQCRKDAYGMVRPRILSPKKDIVYSLRSYGADSKNIPFYAIVDGNVRRLKWYVDSQLVGEGNTGEPFVWVATRGPHTIEVMDEWGRSSMVSIHVAQVD